MMTRQSVARVSSASTEADFAPPGMIPFDWEAAPGRPGRGSIRSGNIAAAGRNVIAEGSSLPLPPGRRPKDGFYKSHSQPGESPVAPGRTSSQPRKSFKLKFPGSSPSTSRTSSQPPKDCHVDVNHSFSFFSPISGHKFGSSITRRMLEHLTKKQSLWRRCLASKPESESKGRRLDSVDEGTYFTAVDSPIPSLPSSPGHGSPVVTKQMLQPASPSRHSGNSFTKQMLQPSSPGYGHSSNSIPKQMLQPSSPGYGHSSNSSPKQASSRFMASMLISLCPEADDPDERHSDAVDEIIDNYNDDTRSSSPEPIFETAAKPSECSTVIEVDPEECRCTCKHRAPISARVDLPTPQVNQTTRSVSRNLNEELAKAGSPSHHLRSGNTVTGSPSPHLRSGNTVAADGAPPKARRRTELCHSSFSWKPCTETSQEAVADLGSGDEPGDHCEFAKEIFEVHPGEKYECRAGYRSPAQDFSAGSSSSPESNSRHDTVWSRANSFSTSFIKDVDVTVLKPKRGAPTRMVGYLSPPRTSSGDSEYTSTRDGSPRAFGRWKSTAELRKSSRSERNQPRPVTRSTVNFLSPPRKQALQQESTAMPRMKDCKQTLKSSSQRRIPSIARNDDTDDEGAECSTDSSPRAVPSSPNFASPKPPPLLLPEEMRKSPSLSHREWLPLPQMEGQETALPGPTFKQVLLARNHSVRSPSSRVFIPQECYAATNLRGPDPPPAASRLAKSTSSSVMSKVAEWEAKVGVGSSAKSAPLYRFNRTTMSKSSTTAVR